MVPIGDDNSRKHNQVGWRCDRTSFRKFLGKLWLRATTRYRAHQEQNNRRVLLHLRLPSVKQILRYSRGLDPQKISVPLTYSRSLVLRLEIDGTRNLLWGAVVVFCYGLD